MNSLPMSKQLEPLLKIQEIDIRITTYTDEDKKWQSQISATEAKLAQLDAQLNTLKEQRTSHQMERDRLQLEADEEQERINNYEKRIRELSHTREYQALAREVSVSKKARADAEESALAAMEKIEAIEAEINKLVESRSGVAAELEQQRHAYASIRAKNEAEMGPLQNERSSYAKSIDSKILMRYNAIRTRQVNAVVFAAAETCSGCNRKLPPQLFNQVLRDASLITCPSCKRILLPQVKPSTATTATPTTAAAGTDQPTAHN
jgi:hypothetical protein